MSRYAYVPAILALVTGLFFAVGFVAATVDYLGPSCVEGGAMFPCDGALTAMKLLGALLLGCLLLTVLTLPKGRRNG